MRVMGIPGLTLYHLKSHLQVFDLITCFYYIYPSFGFYDKGEFDVHILFPTLQKYRLGKNHQQSETCSESRSEATDCKENPSIDVLNLFDEEKLTNDSTEDQFNE